jgi:protein TonB
MRLEGSVTLDASVAEDGTVREVKVLRGQPILAAAAVAAVQQWRYSPSLLNGKPTPAQRKITVTFKLR